MPSMLSKTATRSCDRIPSKIPTLPVSGPPRTRMRSPRRKVRPCRRGRWIKPSGPAHAFQFFDDRVVELCRYTALHHDLRDVRSSPDFVPLQHQARQDVGVE